MSGSARRKQWRISDWLIPLASPKVGDRVEYVGSQFDTIRGLTGTVTGLSLTNGDLSLVDVDFAELAPMSRRWILLPEDLELVVKSDVVVETPVEDAVKSPSHYTRHPSGIEAIDITEHFGFCLGNAIKYIWRADYKGNPIEDLEKAAWYVNREIERRKKLQST